MDTQDRLVTKEPHEQDPQDPIASVEDSGKPLDIFGKIIFVVVAIEIALMFGLNFFQTNKIEKLQSDIQQAKTELNSEEYKNLNKQVEEVLTGSEKLSTVLASKLNWNGFYAKLNAVTPKNVRLTAINISSNGAFKADGETATLSSLAHLLVSWQNGTQSSATPFSSVALTSNGFTSGEDARRVTFSISAQIDLSKVK
ncbi:hypothetical protein HY844_02860 [Candidatus Berkelbacteria bacterium]|nr:hypothetical protein [Candidatus Berkelbacteria bacterium]